jgi:RHS repeat-associated protein
MRRYDTNFPDEESVGRLYDGLDHRRTTNLSDSLTWHRWNGSYIYADYVGTKGENWTYGAVSRTYMPGKCVIVGSDAATGTYRYYTTDFLGSVRRLRNDSKTSVATFEYTPYGDELSVSGLKINRGFTGHVYEPQTGMYFAPYRFYSPEESRWLSRDPLGMVDGPNVYAYVRDNPIDNIDALGLHILYWPNHPADPYYKWPKPIQNIPCCQQTGPTNAELLGMSSSECARSIVGDADGQPGVSECLIVCGIVGCKVQCIGYGLALGAAFQYVMALLWCEMRDCK